MHNIPNAKHALRAACFSEYHASAQSHMASIVLLIPSRVAPFGGLAANRRGCRTSLDGSGGGDWRLVALEGRRGRRYLGALAVARAGNGLRSRCLRPRSSKGRQLEPRRAVSGGMSGYGLQDDQVSAQPPVRTCYIYIGGSSAAALGQLTSLQVPELRCLRLMTLDSSFNFCMCRVRTKISLRLSPKTARWLRLWAAMKEGWRAGSQGIQSSTTSCSRGSHPSSCGARFTLYC